jgi:hypothetical protein
MYWVQNVYSFFQTFFEFISFRSKPANISLNDVENPVDYEYVILNDKNQMNR